MARQFTACLSVLFIAVSVSCTSASGPSASAASGNADPRVAAPVAGARPSDEAMAKIQKEFRFDDFEQMIIVLNLAGDQEKAFRDNMAARLKKLEAHKASDLAKQAAEGAAAIKAAETAKDEKKVAELKAKYGDAMKKDRAAMEDLRRIVMGPLSAQQRQYWAQFALYRGLCTALRATEPTAAQKDQWWTACAGPAGELVAADYVATNPYLSGDAAKAAAAKVRASAEKTLTEDQAKKLPKEAN